MTLLEARRKCCEGWNLRCNVCGEHPAQWHDGQRPGWGSLALCVQHSLELEQEIRRHNCEMVRLRTINFEQLYPWEIQEMVKQAKTRAKARRVRKVAKEEGVK